MKKQEVLWFSCNTLAAAVMIYALIMLTFSAIDTELTNREGQTREAINNHR